MVEPKYQKGQRVYMRHSEVEIKEIALADHWSFPFYYVTHKDKPWGWYSERWLTEQPTSPPADS